MSKPDPQFPMAGWLGVKLRRFISRKFRGKSKPAPSPSQMRALIDKFAKPEPERHAH